MKRVPTTVAVTGAVVTMTAAGLLAVPSAMAAIHPSVAPAAATAATAATECGLGQWQDRVAGSPRVAAGGASGVYLWHDARGFHVRVTHPGTARQVFTGVITSSAPMTVAPFRLEKGDFVKLSADHRSAVFGFADYGHLDGVDFRTACARTVTLSRLNRGNAALPASQVRLGAHQVHPARVPFVIARERPGR
jgi:hypothetical protein